MTPSVLALIPGPAPGGPVRGPGSVAADGFRAELDRAVTDRPAARDPEPAAATEDAPRTEAPAHEADVEAPRDGEASTSPIEDRRDPSAASAVEAEAETPTEPVTEGETSTDVDGGIVTDVVIVAATGPVVVVEPDAGQVVAPGGSAPGDAAVAAPASTVTADMAVATGTAPVTTEGTGAAAAPAEGTGDDVSRTGAGELPPSLASAPGASATAETVDATAVDATAVEATTVDVVDEELPPDAAEPTIEAADATVGEEAVTDGTDAASADARGESGPGTERRNGTEDPSSPTVLDAGPDGMEQATGGRPTAATSPTQAAPTTASTSYAPGGPTAIGDAPAPPSTAQAATAAARAEQPAMRASIERVMATLDAIAKQPPPRALTLDLSELHGVRVTLTIDEGTVNVSVSDTGAGDAGTRQWQDQLDQLLDDRDHERPGGGGPAPSSDVPSAPRRPTARPDELRL